VSTINNNLFRKKNIEKISSPEQLNDFIKVSKPSIWLILIAIILIIVGVGIWSVSGKLETRESAVISVSNGEGHIYLTYDQVGKVDSGMTVRVDNCEGTIVGVDYSPIKINDEFDIYTKQLGKMTEDEWYYDASVDIDLEDGVYSSDIVIDSVSPIYFLFD
jgi:hypothetical protein